MSSFLEKEKQLIKAMHQQDFQPFFEGDKDDAFDTLANALDSFATYQNSVIHMTIMQPIIYARYEGQDLRDKISDMDSHRRSAHESAIANINMLNRICKAYGVEEFANINTQDRYQVADFVGQYCAEIYETGKSKDPEVENIKTMDDLMKYRNDRQDQYETNNRKRLTDIDAMMAKIKFNEPSSDDLSL